MSLVERDKVVSFHMPLFPSLEIQVACKYRIHPKTEHDFLFTNGTFITQSIVPSQLVSIFMCITSN